MSPFSTLRHASMTENWTLLGLQDDYLVISHWSDEYRQSEHTVAQTQHRRSYTLTCGIFHDDPRFKGELRLTNGYRRQFKETL